MALPMQFFQCIVSQICYNADGDMLWCNMSWTSLLPSVIPSSTCDTSLSPSFCVSAPDPMRTTFIVVATRPVVILFSITDYILCTIPLMLALRPPQPRLS